MEVTEPRAGARSGGGPGQRPGQERRKGRRESDLVLLGHLAEVLAEEPEAVFLHAAAVIERMEPEAWAWIPPGEETMGRFEHLSLEAAERAEGETFAAVEVAWFRPAKGILHRKAWPDGEVFLFAREAEVSGAERWERVVVSLLACLLRGARRAASTQRRPKIALYGSAEAETLTMLGGEVERTRRIDLPLSVVFFRLGGVAQLNRTRGLTAGDAAFSGLAAILARYAGEGARYGRAGTDGFLVVFPTRGRGVTEAWLARFGPRIEAEVRDEMREAGLFLRARLGEIPGDAPDAVDLARFVGLVPKGKSL